METKKNKQESCFPFWENHQQLVLSEPTLGENIHEPTLGDSPKENIREPTLGSFFKNKDSKSPHWGKDQQDTREPIVLSPWIAIDGDDGLHYNEDTSEEPPIVAASGDLGSADFQGTA